LKRKSVAEFYEKRFDQLIGRAFEIGIIALFKILR